MTDAQVLPVYALIDYAWELLKSNTDMKEADYGGRIPIIPSAQEPEFTDVNKPFIVYAWSEGSTNDVYAIRSGQISFVVYGTTDREINKISNLLVVAFNQWDMSAANINQWAVGGPFSTIRFATTWAGTLDGPTPEQTEGGRVSSVVMIRYRYITDYDLVQIPGSFPASP